MRNSPSPAVRVALYGVMCVMLIPFVFPTWWMITSSLKPISHIFAQPPDIIPRAIDLSSYVEAFTFQPYARQYFNSIYIAAIVTVVTMFLSAMAGYAFARIRFKGANQIGRASCRERAEIAVVAASLR